MQAKNNRRLSRLLTRANYITNSKKNQSENPTATTEEINQIRQQLTPDELGTFIAEEIDLESEQDRNKKNV